MSAAQQPVPVNVTPKGRFMQSGDNIIKHRALIDSAEYRRGADFTLMHYTEALAAQAGNGQQYDAMAMGLKLQGAIEFLQCFRTLAETLVVSRPAAPGGLNEKA